MNKEIINLPSKEEVEHAIMQIDRVKENTGFLLQTLSTCRNILTAYRDGGLVENKVIDKPQ